MFFKLSQMSNNFSNLFTEKKNPCTQWICAVQTRVVQGPNVLFVIKEKITTL